MHILVNMYYFTLVVIQTVKFQYFEEHSFQNVKGINFFLDKYHVWFLNSFVFVYLDPILYFTSIFRSVLLDPNIYSPKYVLLAI